jgi:hypothetical protein
VHLVTTTVVRLVRTLAHEEISETVRVTRSDGSNRGVGWHRPSAGAILLVLRARHRPEPGCCEGRRRLRGHAAPVDTGSTAQRYAVPLRRVKPSACGQPLDPQVRRLLAFAGPEIPHGRRPHLSPPVPGSRRSTSENRS